MPNDYFRFKQFTVLQDETAMKVCTDACLFGAVVAEKIGVLQDDIQSILDIGTGTGLLSLMLAQKTNATVHAVEIDEKAARQAQRNIAASPWANQIEVFHSAIQQFTLPPAISNGYDLIITNPPFYANDLKSNDPKRNMALHSVALSLEELLIAIQLLLSPTGFFAVMLPFRRSSEFLKLAESAGIFLYKHIAVKQTEKHAAFRSILFFGRTQQQVEDEVMIIKEDGRYSEQFEGLLGEYYLYL